MRILSITACNYGPYKGTHTIAVPESKTKVAVVGDNGEGKTFLLDAIPLALFGRAPNRRGEFYELFNDEARQPVRDGLIEVALELDGKTVVVRRQVDSVARKQLPTIMVDGVVLTEGKVKQFEAAMADLRLDETVFFTTAYAAQNGAGHLIGLSDGERRGIFEAVLNLGAYRADWFRADAAWGKLARNLEDTSASVAALESLAQNEYLLAKKLEFTRAEIQAKGRDIEALGQEMEALQTQAAELKANAQEASHLDRAIIDLNTADKADQAIVADHRQRIDNNRALLAGADDIRQAVAQLEANGAEAEHLEGQRAELEARREAELAESRQAHQALVDAKRLAYEEAQREHSDSVNRIQQLLPSVERYKREIQALEQKRGWLTEQSGLVEIVPCQDNQALFSTCPLLENARNARAELETVKAKLIELHDGLSALPDLEEAKARNEQASIQLMATQQELLAASAQQPAASQVDQAIREVAERLNALKQERTGLLDRARNADKLALADERIAQYQQVISETLARIEARAEHRRELQAKRAAAANYDAELARLAIQREQGTIRLRTLQADYGELIKAVATIEHQLEGERRRQMDLAKLKHNQALMRAELSRVEMVREGLSPKGAPALLVDAACPEVAALINALLVECYGPRFAVRIDTLKENLTNDNAREAIQVKVVDTDTCNETPVESLSGGEQAIVREAISLGLCIFARQRCGVDIRCLIRDECTAPLSDGNGERYIRMLDRAVKMGGFDQVLFVSHKGTLQQMADATLMVAHGTVTAG